MSSVELKQSLITPCPGCGKEFTLRTRRKGLFERLISLFYFYPFGCQLCGRRFIAFKWRVHYRRQPIDRRQFKRIDVVFPCRFKVGVGHGEAVVVDISAGGCRLKSDFNFAEGALVELVLALPGHATSLSIETAIVRVVESEYVGFEFLQMDSGAREVLGNFILQSLDISSESVA